MTQYFTDFSEYTAGAEPSDWTKRWHASDGTQTWDVVSDPPAGSTGGQALKHVSNSESNRSFITWNDIDGDAARDEVEILVKMRTDTSDAWNLRTLTRGSGGTTDETGYVGSLRSLNDDIDAGGYDNGSSVGTANAAMTVDADIWYWARFRYEGTTIKMKAWVDGDAEPSTWAIDETQTAPGDMVGWVGVGGGGGTGTQWFDVFAVGTNGDTAPSSGAAPVDLDAEEATELDEGVDSTLAAEPRTTVEEATEADTGQAATLAAEHTFTAEVTVESNSGQDAQVNPEPIFAVETAAESDSADDAALTAGATVNAAIATEADTAIAATMAPERAFTAEVATEADQATDANLVLAEPEFTAEAATEEDEATDASPGPIPTDLPVEWDTAFEALLEVDSTTERTFGAGVADETDTAVEVVLTAGSIFIAELATETATATESDLLTDQNVTAELATETATGFASAPKAEPQFVVGAAIETDESYAVALGYLSSSFSGISRGTKTLGGSKGSFNSGRSPSS